MKLLFGCIIVAAGLARAADGVAGGEEPAAVSSYFERGNAHYERGEFRAAAGAYEEGVERGGRDASLLFNLGNAWYRAGEYGRAIAAYRLAQELAPRDPDIRFNLEFVREKVTGNEGEAEVLWRDALRRLTLNEWTLLAVSAYWAWLALLCVREARPGWAAGLRGYILAAGCATVLSGLCLGGAVYESRGRVEGVVTTSEAVVRYGPLAESAMHFQLRDGSEVTVRGLKRVGAEDPVTWYEIEDRSGRSGWVRADQLRLI